MWRRSADARGESAAVALLSVSSPVYEGKTSFSRFASLCSLLLSLSGIEVAACDCNRGRSSDTVAMGPRADASRASSGKKGCARESSRDGLCVARIAH